MSVVNVEYRDTSPLQSSELPPPKADAQAGKIVSIAQESPAFGKYADLAVGVPLNFARDATWAGFSALQWNAACCATPAVDSSATITNQLSSSPFLQQLGGQCAFGIAAMGAVAICQAAYCKARGKPVPTTQILASTTAAAAAIPMWDLGQIAGAKAGEALFGPSPLAMGLMAAPVVGMLEGPTQWLVQLIFRLATDPKEREKIRQNPWLLLKEFLLNITIGAIPGMMWQIVYFLALPAVGPWGTLALVALTVAICNIGSYFAIQSTSQWIDRKMKWDQPKHRSEIVPLPVNPEVGSGSAIPQNVA